MGVQLNIWLILTVFCVPASLKFFVHAEPQVPCYFIFGDSLVDNGNNNDIISFAKTNYFPYGLDYPSGHTGRFTNGRTSVDFIAEYLGFEDDIPAHAFTNGRDILNGLNYASGAGGIRSESGKLEVGRISFDGQLQNHGGTVSRIFNFLGENATIYLHKCLYTVGMGSNDYLNNYLLPVFESNKQYNPTEYATVLIQQYSQQLTTLYNYGARKIATIGLGPIGCIPYSIVLSGSKTCWEKANYNAQLFDNMLSTLVDTLNHDFPNARFVYVNSSHLFATLAPDSGIINRRTACCKVTPVTGLCIPHSIPCKNRDIYLFYDQYHPTERFTQLGAERAYKAISPFDVYPYDISTLVHLQLYSQ